MLNEENTTTSRNNFTGGIYTRRGNYWDVSDLWPIKGGGRTMKKARIIGHLQELDGIRRDEYMPEDVVQKVIELEKLLTSYLARELEENPENIRNSDKYST